MGGRRKTRYRSAAREIWPFTLSAAVYNSFRMPELLGVATLRHRECAGTMKFARRIAESPKCAVPTTGPDLKGRRNRRSFPFLAHPARVAC
jgi:hypothetical protein